MNILEKIKLLHRAFKYRYIDDQNEIRYLLDHVKKGDVVLDIGAHKGGYTYWMQKAVGRQGKVVAFEPQAKGAALLQKLFPAVKVERKAVSSHPGETTLYISPQVYDVSFEASVNIAYDNAIREIVVATTIDEYCAMHSLKPSFIKIDVEGHELDVLKGAENTLRSAWPNLLVEAEIRHAGKEGLQELFQFLKLCNYSGSFYFNRKVLRVEEFKSQLHQQPERVSNRKLYANNFMFEPKQPKLNREGARTQ